MRKKIYFEIKIPWHPLNCFTLYTSLENELKLILRVKKFCRLLLQKKRSVTFYHFAEFPGYYQAMVILKLKKRYLMKVFQIFIFCYIYISKEDYEYCLHE